MNLIVRLILRYSRLVILFTVLLSVPAAYFSAKLYGNVKPDIEELLPRQSRSVLDLEEIRARLKSVQQLGLLIDSEDTRASRRFVDDLAKRLEAFPKDRVAGVEYRIDREIKYFKDRRALFIEERDLQSIHDYIKDRIEYERELHNPLNIFSGVEIPEPTLDFEGIRRKYEGKASAYDRFPGGYYATPDEKKRLFLVYLPAERAGVEGTYAFKADVQRAVEELDPKSYAKDMRIRYTGGVQDMIEEHTALMNDIEKSAQIVFTVVLLALVVFFRSVLATAVLLFALFMARFWTFGASWFVVGSLNANSAFMGSIVLGSGITFGVMLLARYLEERRAGRVPLRAARIAMIMTARATWTAALAAGFAYSSLYFTEFEGFRQYGIMGFMGMVLCWLASILVLPALLVEVERWRSLVRKTGSPRASWIFGPVTRMLDRFPGTILAGSVAVTVAALASFAFLDPDEIVEKNLANLRNKTSMTEGSGFFSKEADAILGSASTPLIVLAHERDKAAEIADRLKAQLEAEGKTSLMSSVGSIRDFIPGNQAGKVAWLRKIDRAVPLDLRYRMDEADRRQMEELLDPKGLRGIAEDTLPPLIREKFTEKDGAVGRLVIVDPRPDSANFSGEELNRLVNDVRRTADEVEGRKVPVAGTLTVTADMIGSIVRDGPKASMLAFGLVVLLIFALFRKPRIAVMMLSGLVLGMIWMFGIIIGADIKINFLNFIAIPITFGIGVDYGVNVIDRYLNDPKRDILKVVRETGGAVGLCSFTTIVGYSSLLIADNQAFVSFGTLAVMGEVTTMLAAVLAIPSFMLVLERRRARKVPDVAAKPAAPVAMVAAPADPLAES